MSTALTYLQRWTAQVHVAPGPYLANNLDLTPLINGAKPGSVISCTPHGAYHTSSTATVPAGVQVYLNGASLSCTPSADASSCIVLEAGALFNGAHVTKANVLFTIKGRGVSIHNIFSDDHAVVTRFIDAELIDTDATANLDVQDCSIGITTSQQIYVTCNLNMANCYLAGSTEEYNFRTEVTGPTNVNRCQKVTVSNCTFKYIVANGKGSTVGLRMCGPLVAAPGAILFTNCYIEGNARIGQQPPTIPVGLNPMSYANGVKFVGCTFVGSGTRECITSLDGATVDVEDCIFYVDKAPISIAIAPTTNKTTVDGSVVHKPAGGAWHRLTNQDAVPGTGTVLSPLAYVVPPAPTPF